MKQSVQKNGLLNSPFGRLML